MSSDQELAESLTEWARRVRADIGGALQEGMPEETLDRLVALAKADVAADPWLPKIRARVAKLGLKLDGADPSLAEYEAAGPALTVVRGTQRGEIVLPNFLDDDEGLLAA